MHFFLGILWPSTPAGALDLFDRERVPVRTTIRGRRFVGVVNVSVPILIVERRIVDYGRPQSTTLNKRTGEILFDTHWTLHHDSLIGGAPGGNRTHLHRF